MREPLATALLRVHLLGVTDGRGRLELEVDLFRLQGTPGHLQQLPLGRFAAAVRRLGLLVEVVAHREKILWVRGGVREPVRRVRGGIVHLLVARLGGLPVVRLYHVVDVHVLVVGRRVRSVVLPVHVRGGEPGEADRDVLASPVGEDPPNTLTLGQVHSLSGLNDDGVAVGVLDVNLPLLDEHPLVELGALPRLRPVSLGLDVSQRYGGLAGRSVAGVLGDVHLRGLDDGHWLEDTRHGVRIFFTGSRGGARGGVRAGRSHFFL